MCSSINAGFIDRLKDGYETHITGKGEGLSQGQRQLICIARALIREHSVLLLDEPTSNLDPVTRAMVQTKILEEKANGTVVIAATHDLDLMKVSDEVVYMERGRTLAKGPYVEMGQFLEEAFTAPPESLCG